MDRFTREVAALAFILFVLAFATIALAWIGRAIVGI